MPFDSVGNLQSMRYGNGVTNLYQYDSRNRLTNLVWQSGSTVLASFGYTLGSTGNRTALVENVNGTARTYVWNYDYLYRLTSEGVGSMGTVNYGFDVVGNRTNRTSTISALPTSNYSYNANDWLSNDTYDANGNTTVSATTNYQYDVLNHLTNANSGGVIIGYDGDGNRVSKKVGSTTTYYLVDDVNPSGYAQVLEEWTSTGTPALNKVYNYGLALISQRQASSGTVSYFGTDGHGSTRFLANTSGIITDTYTFDAYGLIIGSAGTTPNNYLYFGQQFDSDLSFYYLRARYYKPDSGRFWTMDTYEGDSEDPLSLHRYLYGADNLVNDTDPSGHDYGGDVTSAIATLLLNIGPAVSSENGLGVYSVGYNQTQMFNHGPWHVNCEGNINLAGSHIRTSAMAIGSPEGFRVTYNGPEPSDGQAVVYQVCASDGAASYSPFVDRGSDFMSHALPQYTLPPAMGTGISGCNLTSYIDSPVSDNVNFWTFTAVAVSRSEKDRLLSTVQFKFDNSTRRLVLPLDVSDYNDKSDLKKALNKWGVDTGVRF